MAINTFPSVSSPVKSVQRGSAGGAGTVTITAVDISKSFVNIFGTTSSGTVAAAGTIAATTGTAASRTINFPGPYGTFNVSGPYPRTGTLQAGNFNVASTTLSGGSNNLVAAVVQGYLSGSTSLVVSGACRWEVVEFN